MLVSDGTIEDEYQSLGHSKQVQGDVDPVLSALTDTKWKRDEKSRFLQLRPGRLMPDGTMAEFVELDSSACPDSDGSVTATIAYRHVDSTGYHLKQERILLSGWKQWVKELDDKLLQYVNPPKFRPGSDWDKHELVNHAAITRGFGVSWLPCSSNGLPPKFYNFRMTAPLSTLEKWKHERPSKSSGVMDLIRPSETHTVDLQWLQRIQCDPQQAEQD